MNWINKIFKSKESGSALLPVVITIGIFGITTAIITRQNTELMRKNKTRSTLNDYKDIKNNLDHIIDCTAIFESLNQEVCQAPDYRDTFIPIIKYDGSTLIKKPDHTGYTVFADHYLLSAKCEGNGYVLISAAKVLKSGTVPAKYTDKTTHLGLNWYNLFIGRENICGELPYYNFKIKKL